jgi:hypothetical protein
MAASAFAAAAFTAGAAAWNITDHVYCGEPPHPAAPVVWGVDRNGCLNLCLEDPSCNSFAYTNAIWTGQPGCSLTGSCDDPCSAGECANWDLYVCEGASTAADCSRFAVTLSVSEVLGSHMVLQRDVPNAIWGSATPGANVTLSVDDGACLWW